MHNIINIKNTNKKGTEVPYKKTKYFIRIGKLNLKQQCL